MRRYRWTPPLPDEEPEEEPEEPDEEPEEEPEEPDEEEPPVLVEEGGEDVGGEDVGGEDVGGDEEGGEDVGGDEEGGEDVGGEGGATSAIEDATVMFISVVFTGHIFASARARIERAATIRIVLQKGGNFS